MRDFWRDVAYAVRTMRREPGFALVAMLTLALGTGANTAIFSVVNAVVLRPLKAPDAARLVRFISTTGGTSTAIAGAQAFDVWRRQTAVVEAVSAHRLEYVNLTGSAGPEQIAVARVTAGFFRLFQAPIVNGRAFLESEDRPGAARVAVLSDSLWARRFDRDPRVVGHPISLGNVPHVIVGVLAPEFDSEQFAAAPDVWVPFQLDVNRIDGGNLFTVTGRLAPAMPLAAANAQLAVAAAARPTEAGARNVRITWTVEPLRDAMIGDVRSSLALLFTAVGLLLLIACANIASLLLVRADVRVREFAIRAAIGAGRNRLLRQLLTESLVLSLAGSALGLAVGGAGVRLLLAAYPSNNPFRLGDTTPAIPRVGVGGSAVTIDWRVFGFVVGMSIFSALIVGLLPALHASRVDLTTAMKRTAAGRSGGGSRRTHAALVTLEVALAIMLLVGAALLIRTSVALRGVNPGFDARNIVTMRTSLSATRFETRAGIAELTRGGVERIRASPAVVSAAAACCMPLETVWQLPFVVAGRPPDALTRT